MNSRINTIINAIDRSNALISGSYLQEITIHILGAEVIEGSTAKPDELFLLYDNLFLHLITRGYIKFQLLMIGPNLGFQSSFEPIINRTVDEKLSVTIIRVNQLYHEYFDINKDSATLYPDLIVAFNAGLWGYPTWKLTFAQLSEMVQRTCQPLLLLVTSYSALEAEDDYEAVLDMLSCQPTNFVWLWEDEANPYVGIEAPRVTGKDGSEYFDNHSWMCIRISP
jgi:hypothetical protein